MKITIKIIKWKIITTDSITIKITMLTLDTKQGREKFIYIYIYIHSL